MPAARLTANSRLRVNVAFEIWLLLGVNVVTPFKISPNIEPNRLQALYVLREITELQPISRSKPRKTGRLSIHFYKKWIDLVEIS